MIKVSVQRSLLRFNLFIFLLWIFGQVFVCISIEAKISFDYVQLFFFVAIFVLIARARQKLCVFMLSDGILTTRFTSQHSAPSRGQQSQGSMYSYAPGTSAKLICVEFYLFNSISIEQVRSRHEDKINFSPMFWFTLIRF